MKLHKIKFGKAFDPNEKEKNFAEIDDQAIKVLQTSIESDQEMPDLNMANLRGQKSVLIQRSSLADDLVIPQHLNEDL